MQWRLLFRLCYLLDDPGLDEPELEHVAWRLFELDVDEQPARPMVCLYESVLGMDPTGREMCPKPGAWPRAAAAGRRVPRDAPPLNAGVR